MVVTPRVRSKNLSIAGEHSIAGLEVGKLKQNVLIEWRLRKRHDRRCAKETQKFCSHSFSIGCRLMALLISSRRR